jgi:hypothetical protein
MWTPHRSACNVAAVRGDSTPDRIAIAVATLGMALCTFSGIVLIGMLARSRSSATPWAVLPLVLAGTTFVQLLRRAHPGGIWLPLGALVGFSFLSLLSVGAAYVLGALVLIAAGAIDLYGRGASRDSLSAFLYFCTGASAIAVMFLVRNMLGEWRGGRTPRAPILVDGAFVFAGALLMLLLTTIGRRRGGPS